MSAICSHTHTHVYDEFANVNVKNMPQIFSASYDSNVDYLNLSACQNVL